MKHSRSSRLVGGLSCFLAFAILVSHSTSRPESAFVSPASSKAGFGGVHEIQCTKPSVAGPVRTALSAHRASGFVHILGWVGTRHRRGSYQLVVADAVSAADTKGDPPQHDVDGIRCVEVTIVLDVVGPVTVLEATADSQEELVMMALMLEEEDDPIRQPQQTQHKLTTGDPYGAVLWPAASAIANRLLTTPSPSNGSTGVGRPLQGMTVLELGAGTGLISIAASLAGADKVLATDYEDVPLRLLRYAAMNLNDDSKAGREAQNRIETVHLDMCDYATPLPDADVVVAADIMYEPKTGRAMARRAVEALKRGSRVIVGDSPGRPGRPAFLEELRRLLPGIEADFVDTVGTTCTGVRHELICGEGSTSISDLPQPLPVATMDLDPRCLALS